MQSRRSEIHFLCYYAIMNNFRQIILCAFQRDERQANIFWRSNTMALRNNLFFTRLNDGRRRIASPTDLGPVDLANVVRHNLFEKFEGKFGEILYTPRES